MKKCSLHMKKAYLQMFLFICSLSGASLIAMDADTEESDVDRVEALIEEDANSIMQESEKDAASAEAGTEEVKEQTAFVTKPPATAAATAAPSTTQEGIKIGGKLSIDW